MQKKTLFIGGAPRSGTSALVSVLNSNPRLLIGQERFFHLVKQECIMPRHFELDRFRDLREGDTHAAGSLPLLHDEEGFTDRYTKATVVGDKFPLIFLHYEYLLEQFPDAYIFYIIRNPLSVCESYQARASDPNDGWSAANGVMKAIDDWNASVAATLRILKEKPQTNLLLIEYENFFKSADSCKAMFDFLDTEFEENKRTHELFQNSSSLNEKLVPRRDDIRLLVNKSIHWQSYIELLRVCRNTDRNLSRLV